MVLICIIAFFMMFFFCMGLFFMHTDDNGMAIFEFILASAEAACFMNALLSYLK